MVRTLQKGEALVSLCPAADLLPLCMSASNLQVAECSAHGECSSMPVRGSLAFLECIAFNSSAPAFASVQLPHLPACLIEWSA